MKFVELTEWQREPLFQLVEYQSKVGHEVTFGCLARNPLIIIEGGPPETYDEDERGITTAPLPTLMLWQDGKYISYTDQAPDLLLHRSYMRFVLRQGAFDYRGFMRRPAPIRFAVNLWWKLTDDLPSLIWGVIGGTLVFILQKLLELLF